MKYGALSLTADHVAKVHRVIAAPGLDEKLSYHTEADYELIVKQILQTRPSDGEITFFISTRLQPIVVAISLARDSKYARPLSLNCDPSSTWNCHTCSSVLWNILASLEAESVRQIFDKILTLKIRLRMAAMWESGNTFINTRRWTRVSYYRNSDMWFQLLLASM